MVSTPISCSKSILKLSFPWGFWFFFNTLPRHLLGLYFIFLGQKLVQALRSHLSITRITRQDINPWVNQSTPMSTNIPLLYPLKFHSASCFRSSCWCTSYNLGLYILLRSRTESVFFSLGYPDLTWVIGLEEVGKGRTKSWETHIQLVRHLPQMRAFQVLQVKKD